MILSYQEGNPEGETSFNSLNSEKANEIEEILSKQKEKETSLPQTFYAQISKETNQKSQSTFFFPASTQSSQETYVKLPLNNTTSINNNLNHNNTFSHEEECLQIDILKELDKSSIKKTSLSLEESGVNNSSNNNASHSNNSRNFILKKHLQHLEHASINNCSNKNSNNNQSSSSSNNNNPIINEIENYFTHVSEELPTEKTNIKKQENAQHEESSNYNYVYNNNNLNIYNNKGNTLFNQNVFVVSSNITQNTNNNNNGGLFFNNYNINQQINYDSYPLIEIINNINLLAKNQSGCRYLQKKLETSPSLGSEYFFKAIKYDLIELSLDSFGNYFIQKLFDCLSPEEIKECLSEHISKCFMEICLSAHGTRVIQKLLEKIHNQPFMEQFNSLFMPHLLELILNQHSTHIIIKYLSLINYPRNEQVVLFLCQNVQQISTHKHSCCTYQKCVSLVEPFQQKKLLFSIAAISDKLFNDQFGNYITQFALGYNQRDINQIIVNKYFMNFFENTSQKFSSNVFEKCLEYCGPEMKMQIISNICNPNMVKQLLFNMYGNYVLQKAMIASVEPYRSRFISMVAPLMESLPAFPFGNIVIHKLINSFPELESMRYKHHSQPKVYKNMYYNSCNNSKYQNGCVYYSKNSNY